MRLCTLVLPSMVLLLLGADEPSRPATPRPSSRAENLFSEAEGLRTIVYIAPEGAPVAKGQVVCVLDAIPAPDGLKNQKITAAQAEASYRQAELTRQVAEVAVKEYEEGTFKQNLEVMKGNIAMAKAELKRAEDRYEWSRRMAEKKFASEAQRTSDKLNLEKAKFTLEQVNSSHAVLLNYTRPKTIKELRSEVEKARSDELAKKATLELERSKVKAIESRTRASVILSPIDGTVRLARPSRLVEVGSEVCQDQHLLRVVPSEK
jgi:HlyD family secretion protein